MFLLFVNSCVVSAASTATMWQNKFNPVWTDPELHSSYFNMIVYVPKTILKQLKDVQSSIPTLTLTLV